MHFNFPSAFTTKEDVLFFKHKQLILGTGNHTLRNITVKFGGKGAFFMLGTGLNIGPN